MSKVGDILLDLEVVLDKLADQGLQMGDILALVHSHLLVHRPDVVEVYDADGSSPQFFYGYGGKND